MNERTLIYDGSGEWGREREREREGIGKSSG